MSSNLPVQHFTAKIIQGHLSAQSDETFYLDHLNKEQMIVLVNKSVDLAELAVAELERRQKPALKSA